MIRTKLFDLLLGFNCLCSLPLEEKHKVDLNEIKQRFYDEKRDPFIEIVHFQTSIERKPTEIDETSLRVLKYKSPSFM